MRFSKGITPNDLDAAIDQANAEHGYELHAEYSGSTGSSFNARIVPDTSRVHGARMTAPKPWAKPRRVKAACWHAHRDVLAALFALKPEGRVQSAFADYRGLTDFQTKFPATASHDVGSPAMPARICDLCSC